MYIGSNSYAGEGMKIEAKWARGEMGKRLITEGKKGKGTKGRNRKRGAAFFMMSGFHGSRAIR